MRWITLRLLPVTAPQDIKEEKNKNPESTVKPEDLTKNPESTVKPEDEAR